MSDGADPLLSSEGRAPDEVAIDYIKARDFRVVWADGLIGSPTASNHIHFALYAERPALPRREVHRIDPETLQLGPALPEQRIEPDSIVREMACDVMLTPEVAIQMARWLIEQAELIRKLRANR